MSPVDCVGTIIHKPPTLVRVTECGRPEFDRTRAPLEAADHEVVQIVARHG